jgi:hypothetical protein
MSELVCRGLFLLFALLLAVSIYGLMREIDTCQAKGGYYHDGVCLDKSVVIK